MRILQIHTRYRQAGGEDRVVDTERRLLTAAGHEVIQHIEHNPDRVGASAARLAASPWNAAAANRVRRVAERVRPDVAHVHNTWFALSPAAPRALRSLGIPVVMTLHNYRLICAAATLYRDGAPCEQCVASHPWHAVRHACYRGSRLASTPAAATIHTQQLRGTWHRDVDLFLALTEFGRSRFLKAGLPAGRVTVKSNSVPDPGSRHAAPSRSNEVLYVGRLTEEKGVIDLLRAWTAAPSGLRLTIVGEGPLGQRLRASAHERVTFAGALPPEALTARMLGARALVFPSRWYEGQPLVALEAAAAGLPVLHGDLGAMAQLFSPAAEALSYTTGHARYLAEALHRLADDSFVDSYGELTRRRFEQYYTHARAVSRLEEIYHGATATRRA